MALEKFNEVFESWELPIKAAFSPTDPSISRLYFPKPKPDDVSIESIVCREIYIDIVHNKLSFAYRKREKVIRPASELESTLNHMAKFGEIPEDADPGHDWDDHGVGKPVTAMSINLEKPSYLIFLLRSPSNLQFSSTGTPFSINGNDAPEAGKFFFDAIRVDGANRKHYPSETNAPGCKIAYMAVSPKSDKFAYRFNIHVDLIDLGGSNTSTIPFIIDPDVRYPGGSGP